MRAGCIAQAQILTDTAVSATQRLATAIASVNQQLANAALRVPEIASRVGTVFDFIQVADAAYRADIPGVYSNLA